MKNNASPASYKAFNSNRSPNSTAVRLSPHAGFSSPTETNLVDSSSFDSGDVVTKNLFPPVPSASRATSSGSSVSGYDSSRNNALHSFSKNYFVSHSISEASCKFFFAESLSSTEITQYQLGSFVEVAVNAAKASKNHIELMNNISSGLDRIISTPQMKSVKSSFENLVADYKSKVHNFTKLNGVIQNLAESSEGLGDILKEEILTASSEIFEKLEHRIKGELSLNKSLTSQAQNKVTTSIVNENKELAVAFGKLAQKETYTPGNYSDLHNNQDLRQRLSQLQLTKVPYGFLTNYPEAGSIYEALQASFTNFLGQRKKHPPQATQATPPTQLLKELLEKRTSLDQLKSPDAPTRDRANPQHFQEFAYYYIDDRLTSQFAIVSDARPWTQHGQYQKEHVTSYNAFVFSAVNSFPRLARPRDLARYIKNVLDLILEESTPSTKSSDETIEMRNIDRDRRALVSRLKLEDPEKSEINNLIKISNLRSANNTICETINDFLKTMNMHEWTSFKQKEDTDRSLNKNEGDSTSYIHSLNKFYSLSKNLDNISTATSKINSSKRSAEILKTRSSDLKEDLINLSSEKTPESLGITIDSNSFQVTPVNEKDTISALSDHCFNLFDLNCSFLRRADKIQQLLPDSRDDTMMMITTLLLNRHFRILGVIASSALSGISQNAGNEAIFESLSEQFLNKFFTDPAGTKPEDDTFSHLFSKHCCDDSATESDPAKILILNRAFLLNSLKTTLKNTAFAANELLSGYYISIDDGEENLLKQASEKLLKVSQDDDLSTQSGRTSENSTPLAASIEEGEENARAALNLASYEAAQEKLLKAQEEERKKEGPHPDLTASAEKANANPSTNTHANTSKNLTGSDQKKITL